jgi:iron complex outermembrane recepter protein
LTNIAAQDIDGSRNTGETENSSYGFAAQLTRHDQFNDANNELLIGIGLDKARVSFASDSEFAILHNDTVADDRSASGIGLFDADLLVRLDANISHRYIYALNTTEWDNGLSLELAGRFNQSQILMDDLIESGPGSLDGSHRYSRFNPAIGISYNGFENLSVNASYSRSSRTPSPAELSCADENAPCKLPNGFVSDPPLAPVIVKTLELNTILHQHNQQHSLIVYSSRSEHDIIFQQAGHKSSQGYFVNIAQTRRQGLELASPRRFAHYRLTANYSYKIYTPK